jgi:hypothetical protein
VFTFPLCAKSRHGPRAGKGREYGTYYPTLTQFLSTKRAETTTPTLAVLDSTFKTSLLSRIKGPVGLVPMTSKYSPAPTDWLNVRKCVPAPRGEKDTFMIAATDPLFEIQMERTMAVVAAGTVSSVDGVAADNAAW